MRYPNCQKAKAFELFDQGKRPSEIYDLVEVKKHTLFYYHQEWKRERQEQENENERRRLAKESQQRLEIKRRQMERVKQEEMWHQNMMDVLRAQKRIRMEPEHENQKKRVLELEAQMSRAADKPNNVDEVQRIGRLYSQAYDQFRELTRKVYPRYADDESVEMVLHPKQK